MTTTIYVSLLGEGTEVWRPVSAERVRDEIYRITGTPSDDTETWEFTTGETVRCREQTFIEGDRRLVACERVTDDAAYPSPTPDELKMLRTLIEEWNTRTPIQAALALAVLRGHNKYQAVSDYLGVSIPELEEAKKSLWGILYDRNTGKLWVK
jgi:hypothetical protein